MLIPLTLGSNENRTRHLNPSRCVNFYSILDSNSEEGNTSPIAFTTCPGLSVFCALTGAKVRGMYHAEAIGVDRAFAVIDNTLYEIDGSGGYSLIGILSSYTGRIKMKNNPTQLMIVNRGSSEGYIFTFSTNLLATISDPDYPGADDLEYADGYFQVVRNGRDYYSGVLDGTSWSGSDLFTPNYQADPLKSICTTKEDWVLLGTKTIEVFYLDGTTPFSRKPNHSFRYGILAPNSALVVDETVVFLATSETGARYIARLGASTGYDIELISSKSLNSKLSTYGDISDAFAISYDQGGNTTYHITFPSEDKTWVYDFTSKQWHEKQSLTIDNRRQGRHLANCHMTFNNKQLIGDYQSGTIYYFDQTTYKDGDRQITGFIDSVITSNEEKHLRISSLQLDTSSGEALTTGQGSDPLFMYQTSKNNMPFGVERFMRSGAQGEYDTKVMTGSLGSARRWSFKIKYAEPKPQTINRLIAHGSVGAF